MISKRPRPHGADLPRPGDCAAVSAAERDRRHALAVTLNATGRVDVDHLAELLDRDPATALAQLGEAVFRNPSTESWETDDAYLSGSVRTKLALAEAATEQDLQYARNVAALRLVQPEALRLSDITAKLGAPWILAADIEAFALDITGTAARVRHTAENASWSAGEHDCFRIRSGP